VVCLIVTSLKNRVRKEGQFVKQQIQPKIDLKSGVFSISDNEFELCFETLIPAMGFRRYELVESENEDEKYKAKIEVSQNFDKK
jgi:predicted cupin superfamily sugar epimerase